MPLQPLGSSQESFPGRQWLRFSEFSPLCCPVSIHPLLLMLPSSHLFCLSFCKHLRNRDRATDLRVPCHQPNAWHKQYLFNCCRHRWQSPSSMQKHTYTIAHSPTGGKQPNYFALRVWRGVGCCLNLNSTFTPGHQFPYGPSNLFLL